MQVNVPSIITKPVNLVKDFDQVNLKEFQKIHIVYKENLKMDIKKILVHFIHLAFVMGKDEKQIKGLKKKSVRIKGNGLFSLTVQDNIDLVVVDSTASLFIDGLLSNAPFLVFPQSNGRLKVMATQVVMDQINSHPNWQKSFAVILDYLWKYHQTIANPVYKQQVAQKALISHSGTIGLDLQHLEEWIGQLKQLSEQGAEAIQINPDVNKNHIAYPHVMGTSDSAQLAAQLRPLLYVGLLSVIISSVGCSSVYTPTGLPDQSIGNVERISQGRMNYLNGFNSRKPTVLLVHGAGDDNPKGTFKNIEEALSNTHNVILFSYNYRAPIEVLAMDLNAGK